ncbi:pilus assembly protein PilM [Caldichromatium japonicum]|uniref:Pilus assembly protein PilM n=1 Tax=Caldichromatium japonicum TaxID=2699430 RepID=A0A6G7V9Y3_9GAMM|nr:pilus assembly protein PilM [Caldichromatium japonicum]QIK36685.1 pilus assembly protein PilM [Caldichromatium japonicum]
MFGLTRKNEPLLGIDISTTAIKLVELSRTATTPTPRYRVEHYAVESLPPGAISDKKIAQHEAVSEAIRRVVSRSRTKTKRAAVALPGAAVITKVIMLSAALSDAEMEEQIQYGADQHIPYPLEEVKLDFTVLGPAPGNTEMMEVLLVASRSENVDDRASVLEIAGLTPVVVDVESYAIQNACSLLPDVNDPQTRPVVGVVDIGASATTLYVLHDDRIIYTREQNFGGRQLKEEVQRRYSLTDEQAMQKIREGTVADTYEGEVLTPFREALAQQIGRALQFFYSGTSFSSIDRLILAGGTASIPRIQTVVEERLKIPTAVANPFAQMAFASRIDSKLLLREAPEMMVAVGLALRGFD